MSTHEEKAKAAMLEGRYQTIACKSGNWAKVAFVKEDGAYHAHLAWDKYPPSPEDLDLANLTCVTFAAALAIGERHDK